MPPIFSTPRFKCFFFFLGWYSQFCNTVCNNKSNSSVLAIFIIEFHAACCSLKRKHGWSLMDWFPQEWASEKAKGGECGREASIQSTETRWKENAKMIERENFRTESHAAVQVIKGYFDICQKWTSFHWFQKEQCLQRQRILIQCCVCKIIIYCPLKINVESAG